MLNSKIREKLLECNNKQDTYKLLEGVTYPKTNQTSFSGEIIQLPASSGYNNMNVKTQGLYDLSFRVLLLLKFNGHVGLTPYNMGKSGYAYNLHRLLVRFYGITGQIKRMDDINNAHLEEYLSLRSDEVSPTTLSSEIYMLEEWITEANPKLPYFLRLDESLVSNTSLVNTIRENAAILDRQYRSGVGGVEKRLYPLDEMKGIVYEAINLIEEVSEDILTIAPIYIQSLQLTEARSRIYIYRSLKSMEAFKSHPQLIELQNECKSTTNSEGISIKEPILQSIKSLEGACVLIGIIMTGMRVSEFTTLPRFPNFRQDEQYHLLTRLITKTAASEDGEELEMPIPKIGKSAIEILSKLVRIIDGQDEGNLIRSSIDTKYVEDVKSASARCIQAIKNFCKYIGIKKNPTPHQLRHTMAFIIVYLSKGSGLELARLFLGHTSITMTLRYLGHYNHLYQTAIKELEEEDAKLLATVISDEIRGGNKLYGKKGEYITQEGIFMGSYAEEFADLLELSIVDLVKQGKIAILQTPVCICIHDLSNPKAMNCQRGFDIADFTGERPLTARCEPGDCNNAVFTISDIQKLQQDQLVEQIPEEFKARLMRNMYVVNDGGLEEMVTPLEKIIKSYEMDIGA